MKKDIIIAILAITSILSIVYGRYQKAEALKYEAAAIENENRAREMAMHAERQMKLAEQAMRQSELALAAKNTHK